MFHIQGKTGAPGFLGNDGLPVSKPLLYIFNKSEKDAYSLQLNDMLMLFCQMNWEYKFEHLFFPPICVIWYSYIYDTILETA